MISLDDIVAAVPEDVRETFDEDTMAYLQTTVAGKTSADEVQRAVAPFLGMSAKELDSLFARLSLESGDAPSTVPSSTVGSTAGSAAGTGVTTPSLPRSPGPGSKKLRGHKHRKNKSEDDGNSSSAGGAVPGSSSRLPLPPVTAYSQQSRFHAVTVQTLSKDVDLKDVNVTIGEHDLLVDARLWLKAGTHYGMIGRNGAGKSTLLSVIGNKALVGFPENIRTLYVQQLDVVDNGTCVLDTVLAADEEREKRMSDVRAIEAGEGNPEELRAALNTHIARVATERIALAQRTATLRSGARGKKARGDALKAEKSMLADVRKEVFGPEGDEKTGAAAAARALEALYAELEAMDAHSAEARARSILSDLGVSEAMQDGPVRALSGGWRMRVAIAKAMFVQPDILLLDEVTNHLDLAAIAWLQEYLVGLTDITIVCVSHDRDFLNAISEEVIRLKDKQLSYHPGNYDEYEQTEDELRKKRERQHDALERRREHVKKSIEGFLKHARSTQDQKVLGQVASRNKKLERMAGIDKTEDGKRFKVSYWAGYHDTVRPELELIKAEKEVDIRIPAPEALRGAHGPLVSLESASYSYPGKKHRVLKSVGLSIMSGDHIAILGLNGSGKSTLIKLLTGEILPSHGRASRQPRLRLAHYTQHFVDELSGVQDSALGLLRVRAVALAAEHALAAGDPTPEPPKEGDLRRWLGSFEVAGQLAVRPVHTLSGGQRARLALALILYERPHVLLLDEVTNHLDMYAVQGLAAALTEYEGTVVLVTHDRHFVRETADDVYALEDGRLRYLEGGIDEYVATMKL